MSKQTIAVNTLLLTIKQIFHGLQKREEVTKHKDDVKSVNLVGASTLELGKQDAIRNNIHVNNHAHT